MIYVVLLIVAVLGCWFVGKLSKPGSALTGFFGTIIALVGSMSESLTVILFGLGLVGFSALVFLAFNGGRW